MKLLLKQRFFSWFDSYDVYYEEQDEGTIERFRQGLEWTVERAASNQVTIAVEIMDTKFMSSISRWKKWDEMLKSPWFTFSSALSVALIASARCFK